MALWHPCIINHVPVLASVLCTTPYYELKNIKDVGMACQEVCKQGRDDIIVKVNCDPLSENPAPCANIEFELEAILFVQVVSQLNSDYYTNMSQEAWTYHTEL